MATIYSPPLDIKRPTTAAEIPRFLQCISARARWKTDRREIDPIVGRTLEWKHDAGTACYIIWDTKPLMLVRVVTGSYTPLTAAQERCMRLTEIRQRIAKADREAAPRAPRQRSLRLTPSHGRPSVMDAA